VGELVVRVVGGVHALFGAVLFTGGIGLLRGTSPGSIAGWLAVVVGFALLTAMVAAGLRLGLGEPVPGADAALTIAVTLVGGVFGASLLLVTLGR
jgi:hypothetical protein